MDEVRSSRRPTYFNVYYLENFEGLNLHTHVQTDTSSFLVRCSVFGVQVRYWKFLMPLSVTVATLRNKFKVVVTARKIMVRALRFEVVRLEASASA